MDPASSSCNRHGPHQNRQTHQGQAHQSTQHRQGQGLQRQQSVRHDSRPHKAAHALQSHQNHSNGPHHEIHPSQKYQIHSDQKYSGISQAPHNQGFVQAPIHMKQWSRWFPGTKQCCPLDNITYNEQCAKAEKEGRRAYIGNLEWSIQQPDVALWLEGAGFNMTAVDMLMQPEGKRRNHYCHVEFGSAEETNAVVTSLDGHTMRGRPMRIHMSRPTGDRSRLAQQQSLNKSSADDADADISSLELDAQESAKAAKPRGVKLAGGQREASARVWVSGLPHTTNINELEDYIGELFHGFHIESLSGVFAGKGVDLNDTATENSSCCFVDLPSIAEAATAIRILNNRETSWGIARVAFAPGGSQGDLKYRGVNDENKLPIEGK